MVCQEITVLWAVVDGTAGVSLHGFCFLPCLLLFSVLNISPEARGGKKLTARLQAWWQCLTLKRTNKMTRWWRTHSMITSFYSEWPHKHGIYKQELLLFNPPTYRLFWSVNSLGQWAHLLLLMFFLLICIRWSLSFSLFFPLHGALTDIVCSCSIDNPKFSKHWSVEFPSYLVANPY